MNLMQRIRIIPLLIIVAFLAFSVRMVDVMHGVATLSASAMAEEHEKDAPAPVAEHDVPTPDQGALQIVDDAHPAESDEKAKEAAHKEKAKSPPVEWRDASDEGPEYEDVKMEVFDDLSERRKALDQQEKELTTREALLRAAEQELDRKYQELSRLKQEIEALLQKQSDEEQGRIGSLVKIYEGMKPKEAARIFDTLDIDVLLAVMSKMSERKLSPILANMNPERARTITILLAQEKQLPTLPQSN